MNQNPHEQHERHREAADPPPERPELGEKTGTPGAVEAAHVRRHGDQGMPGHGRRVRGVEWVRPTDLIARHSATLSGRGIDFQAELARRTRTTVASGVRGLAERARRLPPLSAFGRSGTSPSGPVRSGVGMNG